MCRNLIPGIELVHICIQTSYQVSIWGPKVYKLDPWYRVGGHMCINSIPSIKLRPIRGATRYLVSSRGHIGSNLILGIELGSIREIAQVEALTGTNSILGIELRSIWGATRYQVAR